MLPAQVSYWQLQETSRHNKEMERLTGEDIAEKTRHNKADEGVRIGTLAETTRNNLYGNQQQDRALGIQAMDADTRRFSAISNNTIGLMNAESNRISAKASSTQAAAAMMNAGTNQMVGYSTADLNRANAELQRGRDVREQIALPYDLARTSSQTSNYDASSGKMNAETEYTEKQTSQADAYLLDRQKQTDIKQQEAYNHQFGKILDNLTPWR